MAFDEYCSHFVTGPMQEFGKTSAGAGFLSDFAKTAQGLLHDTGNRYHRRVPA